MEYKSDPKQEQEHLKNTIGVIERSLVSIKRERDAKAALLRELVSKFGSESPEYYNDIPITQSLLMLYIKMIRGYGAALQKPYFGKIIFDSEGEENTLYIGKTGITDFDRQNRSGIEALLVIDWRAPVSELYYSTSFGKTGYEAPGGYIEADVHLKTSFDIENGELLGVYDSDIMANDELLIKYLSKNKDTVLTDIVATIQQEQNDIIRLTPHKNVIVQGVAGSGKTTVAIHRVSYLLYNFSEILNSENVYIIASGKLFLNYMTSMLPDLDVPEIKQGTLFDFLSDYIREYDPKFKCSAGVSGKAPDIGAVQDDIEAINTYFEDYERAFYENEGSLWFFDIEIISGSYTLEYIRRHRRQGLLDRAEQLDSIIVEKLYRLRDEIVSYILAHKDDAEILELCAKVLKIDAAFIFEEDVSRRFSRLVSKYRHNYFNKLKKLNYLKVYATMRERKAKNFCVRELSALALIVNNLRLNDSVNIIRHIVIDEAQDFDLFIYSCLERIFRNARFTLVGDVMQVISESGLQSWDEVRDYVFKGGADFRTLTKSYRNTVEISDFARALVSEYSDTPLYIEPVIRHGREVCFYEPVDIERQISRLLGEAKEYNMCAVICADDSLVKRLHAELGERCGLKLLEQELDALERGNYVLALKDAKGLEFDMVILPDFDSYDLKSADLKRAYVAITRALHELHVFTDRYK